MGLHLHVDKPVAEVDGHEKQVDNRRAADAGFSQHVAKPPTLEGLDRLVAEAPAGSPRS